eukprot:362011-Chlamydomonas_euryale.AAC.6
MPHSPFSPPSHSTLSLSPPVRALEQLARDLHDARLNRFCFHIQVRAKLDVCQCTQPLQGCLWCGGVKV